MANVDTLEEVNALKHKTGNSNRGGLKENTQVLDLEERRWLDEDGFNQFK